VNSATFSVCFEYRNLPSRYSTRSYCLSIRWRYQTQSVLLISELSTP
jgi:hypothetical protein